LELTTFVAGRALDDDAAFFFTSEAAREESLGESGRDRRENGLNLRVYGRRESPVAPGGAEYASPQVAGRPREILRTGANYGRLSEKRSATASAGHPRVLEAFANLTKTSRRLFSRAKPDVPTVEDGVRGWPSSKPASARGPRADGPSSKEDLHDETGDDFHWTVGGPHL
jgi:hypothetical protein